jgi:hypothetical protein
MSFIREFVDERFLEHRRRSTSAAGIAAAELALLLFLYRHYVDDVWNWDLLVVGVTFVIVKIGLMVWYRARN